MIIAFYPGAGGNRYLQRLLGHEWALPNISYDSQTNSQLYSHRYLLDLIPPTHKPYILTHCMNSQKIQQTFPGHQIVCIKSNLKTSLQREWALHGHERFIANLTKKAIAQSKLEHYRDFRAPDWPTVDSHDQLDQLPQHILQEVHLDYNQVISTQVHAVPSVLAQLTKSLVDKINSAYEIIQWHLQYYDQNPVDFTQAQQVIDIDCDHSDFCTLMQTELSRYQSEIFDQAWKAINEQ